MKIIALNTAFMNASVCLKNEDKVICQVLDATAKSSENILPKIDEVLQSETLNIGEINYIGVVVGPGSFTGVRIAVALAKGFLSVFKNMKAISINSLDLMAYEWLQSNKEKQDFYVIQNALSGRFFLAKFDKNGNKISQDELVSELPKGKLIGLESEKLSEANAWIKLKPENLIAYTEIMINQNKFVDENNLIPVYIRLSQAEENLLNNSIKIEKLAKKDIEQISKISLEQFDANGWQFNLFEEELSLPKHYSYVGKLQDNTIVSFMFFMETYGEIGKEYNILNIATKKGEENKGYATKMFDYLKKFAIKNKAKSLWLEVRENNTNAIVFYKNFGFEVDYIRKKYYSNGENAIVMSLKL